MKIKDLKKAIIDLDDEMEVIIQKDGEGSGFSPLDSVDPNCIYIAENTYSGDAFNAKWTNDDVGMDKEEWEDILKLPRSLMLIPVN